MRSTTLIFLFSLANIIYSNAQQSYEYILATKQNSRLNSSSINEIISKQEGKNIQFSHITPISKSQYLFKLEAKKPLTEDQLSALNTIEQFDFCYPNLAVTERNVTPNDDLFGEQWNLNLINAPKVWESMTGGTNSQSKNIVVAVIDTDFDIDHYDLTENIFINIEEIPDNGIDDDANGFIDDVRGYDFYEEIPSIIPSGSGHGTKVAGVLGAVGNNEVGLTGLNWSISILPLRIKYWDEYIQAQQYIKTLRDKYNASNGEQGAYIVAVNASLGFDGLPLNLIEETSFVYDELGNSGILNVGSVPNENVNIDTNPDITSAESDFLITVTNTSYTDVKTQRAGYGALNCDLGAPGGDITRQIHTLDNFDEIEDISNGTSFSSPLVSGTISLLYNQEISFLDDQASQNPAATALFIKELILQSVKPIESLVGKTVTGGRLDAHSSLLSLHQHFQTLSLDPADNYVQELKILKIFPNPSLASDEIKIIFAHDCFEALDYNIYDAEGKTVSKGEISVEPLTENQSLLTLRNHLSSGVYCLKLFNTKTFVVTKFVIL